jgi:TPR repeat protein
MNDSNPYDFDLVLALYEAKDYKKIAEYVRPYAEVGVAEAQCELGVQYHLGLGVEADLLEAERWPTKAAQQKNAVAWSNLGTLYLQRDPERSRHCYRRAVALGFNPATLLAE